MSDGSRHLRDKGTGVRPAVSVMLLTVGLLVFLGVAWFGRIILLLLFAAVVIAVLLTAIVEWLKVKLRMKEGLAYTLILVTAAGLGVLLVWLVGPKIVDQFADLQVTLPAAAYSLVERVRGYGWGRWVLAQWSDSPELSGGIRYAVTRLGGMMLSAANMLGGLLIVVFLTLYLAAEPTVYFAILRRAVPAEYRGQLEACAKSAVRMLRWWLLSQMLSMASVGLIVMVGLAMLGVPLAVTLGMIAALMTFVPNVGPILSVVPAALLAVVISPMKGLMTVLLFMLVHFLEGNVITPLLERKIVRLPPALTLTMQLLFAVGGGALGVALAAPFTAAAMGVFEVLLPEEGTSLPVVVTGKEALA